MRTLQEEMRLREDLATAQKQPGYHLDIGAKVKVLAHHLKKYPIFYGSLQKASDPCFICGASLRKLKNPHYGVKKDVQGKKKRRKERFELIRAARAKAAKMPEGEAKRATLKTADEFARYMDAAEKAVLSRDAYHFTDDKINAEGAPAGYLRGSENPELLKKFGISRSDLAPRRSMFRAEIYLPDPDVFGADAKPVLVLKGTDLTCPDDIEADVAQAGGKPNNYYKQAIELGKLLSKNTYGRFEAAGHSLGGGMASAVGMVTGCVATVFNPAGLHPNTVAPYIKNVPTDPSNISAYVVKGEVVNSGQDAANDAGRIMMISSAQTFLPSLIPAGGAPLMVGVQLCSAPNQVGVRTNLPPQIGSETPNIVKRHLMDTVISSLEQEKRKEQMELKKFLLQKGRVIHGTEKLV